MPKDKMPMGISQPTRLYLLGSTSECLHCCAEQRSTCVYTRVQGGCDARTLKALAVKVSEAYFLLSYVHVKHLSHATLVKPVLQHC